MTIVFDCQYDPPHTHEYPDDWDFGGASGMHPGTDKRYQPSTYVYFDDQLTICDITQVPLCDDEAIDRFTMVARNARCKPKWIQVTRPNGVTETLPVRYDAETDTAVDT